MAKWRWIRGYEGEYEISDEGEVRSYKTGKPVIMATSLTGRGYKHFCLRRYGKQKGCYIHRAVAEAFIPNPKNLPCINHIDEDKLNNNVSNLEWCTYHENNVHGTRMKRIVAARAGQVVSKETREKMSRSHKGRHYGGKPVICIETGRKFRSARAAENEFGASKCLISGVCGKPNRTACGYHWEYV